MGSVIHPGSEFPRLVICDPAPVMGGAERWAQETAKGLSGRGWEVILLRSSDVHDPREDSGVKIQTLDLRRVSLMDSLTGGVTRRARALKNALRELQPDLILSNSLRSLVYLQASGMIREGEIPIAHMQHEWGVPRILHSAYSSLSGLYTCSESVSRYMRDLGYAVKGELLNSMPESLFSLQPRPLGSPPKIGIYGRIDSWKGHGVFLEAAEILRKRGHLDWQMDIVGLSTPTARSYEQRIRQRNTDRGGLVQFRGGMDREAFMSEYDLMVHAATSPEPFGRVVLEAMSAGTVLLAADHGGVQEMLDTDELSLLRVPPGDPLELARRIEWALSLSPEQWSAVQSSLREKAKNYASAEVLRSIDEELRQYGESSL